MKPRRLGQEEALSHCAWCDREIAADTSVYAIGMKVRSGTDLAQYEGEAITVTLLADNKIVPLLVPTTGSQAKLDGKDLMVMTCSQPCGKAIKSALEDEASFGEIIEHFHNS